MLHNILRVIVKNMFGILFFFLPSTKKGDFLIETISVIFSYILKK